MKQVMRHVWKKTGWLVMAAALTWVMASCAADDSIIEQQQPQPETTVGKTLHVTVSAGIADDATTRSIVDYNTTTKKRTLQFTVGDRLYVRGGVGLIQNDGYGDYYKHIIAGYLDIDASTINGSTATFSGDLTVYEVKSVESFDEYYDGEGGNIHETLGYVYSYPDVNAVDATGLFKDPSDPLPECYEVTAVLVHRDAGYNFNFNRDGMREFIYGLDLAVDVNTLMTTILNVTGDYINGSFTLRASSPILNCTVTGLTANATYRVCYSSTTDFNPRFSENFGSTTTADENGTATFAFFGERGENYYHALCLTNTSDPSDAMLVNIGQKTLGAKVYNVTRAAMELPFYVKSRKDESYVEMVNGTYTLEEGYVYYIRNSGRGDITSITTTSGATTKLQLYDGPILKGKVHLEASGDGNAEIIIYSDKNATISNPGQVALQAGSSKATLISTYEKVLTVDGNISGKFQLSSGSTLRVSGSVANAVICDENEATITPVEENGYKVYYYQPIYVYNGNSNDNIITYTVTFNTGATTTLTKISDTPRYDYEGNDFYEYRFIVPYGATTYTISGNNMSWGTTDYPIEVDNGDIVIWDYDDGWEYDTLYDWDDPAPDDPDPDDPEEGE